MDSIGKPCSLDTTNLMTSHIRICKSHARHLNVQQFTLSWKPLPLEDQPITPALHTRNTQDNDKSNEFLWCKPYTIDVITLHNQMWNEWWIEMWILCRHFEWQKWPWLWSLNTASSLLTSAGSDLQPECTRSQQELILTKANKLTCMPRWHSELANCFAVLKLHRPRSFLPFKMVA